jgi:hypothetical protein
MSLFKNKLDELYKMTNVKKEILKKFGNELEGFKYVNDVNDFNLIKKGNYIRYVNIYGEFNYGGIFVRLTISKNKDVKMLLMNVNRKFWAVNIKEVFIFYKHPEKKDSDNQLKRLFLIDMMNDMKNSD